MAVYPNWLLDFLRTLITNSKNLLNNRMGSDPVSNNRPTVRGFFFLERYLLITSSSNSFSCMLFFWFYQIRVLQIFDNSDSI